jgi:hypothetical protein
MKKEFAKRHCRKRVKLYRDKPELVLEEAGQIRVLEKKSQ